MPEFLVPVLLAASEPEHHISSPTGASKAPETSGRRYINNPADARTLAPSARKQKPLIEDIRLLAHILGDVLGEQEGVDALELVERIRKLSEAFRPGAEHEADRSLKAILKSLSGEQTVSVIRAYAYFSHLANLAEDRHHIRGVELPATWRIAA